MLLLISKCHLTSNTTVDIVQWQDVSTRKSLSTTYKMNKQVTKSNCSCKQLTKTFGSKHPVIE